jgi:hypothetical protein
LPDPTFLHSIQIPAEQRPKKPLTHLDSIPKDRILSNVKGAQGEADKKQSIFKENNFSQLLPQSSLKFPT